MSIGDDVPCTAIEGDWDEGQPNILMHPPCECPRCAPEPAAKLGDASWLQLPGQRQRVRVESADLGAVGRDMLG